MSAETHEARSDSDRFLAGWRKLLIYLRIAAEVACRYGRRARRERWQLDSYLNFLLRASHLLLAFRHNKVVRVHNGYKLDLYLPAYPSAAFFHALDGKLLTNPPGAVTVVLSMTKACGYRCQHCYQRRDGGPDLEEGLLLQTAREMRDSGVAMFDVEGGEPLARFPRLLTLLGALDERSEVWVNTTGAGLTSQMLEELKSAGLFGLMVSIHSPDAATHDALTQVPGSFATACAAVRLCRDAGLVAAANSVLSEEEARSGGVDRLMELAHELDCDYVQLIHPKPAGMWLGRQEGMQHDARLIAELRQSHVLYNSGARAGYPALAAQVFEEAPNVLGCTAGAVDRFYVNASGEVQPCEFLNISFGNVGEEPFATILARMRSYFPTPCTDWLCCTQAEAIDRLYREHGLSHTPLPWELTRELASDWDRGPATPLYRKLGLYR